MKISKSRLAITLSKLDVFTQAKVSEEQYPTEPEIAADILWTAYMQGDIDGKIIADLGAGTGILGIGALILGASKVYFIEKDFDAIQIAIKNWEKTKSEYELDNYCGEAVFIHKDILKFNLSVDTVIQNPPFGTKQKHADKVFLEKANEITNKTNSVIYSLHKTNTESFIKAFSDDNVLKISGRLDFEFALKQTMKFHKQKIKRIKVSMWRLIRK